MGIKILARNTAYLSFPKILKFFAGVIRAKLIAVFLGTEGAGIIAQLQNILQNISNFTLAGLPDGMVKQLAKANSNNASPVVIAKIIKTYAVFVGVLTILVYILGFIFSHSLTQYVFGNQEYYGYLIIGFSAMPIIILSSSSYAIIKAYKRIKSLMFAELGIIIVNFLLFFILIYFLRITGVVIFVTLSFFTTFLIYRYIAEKQILRTLGISIRDIYKAEFTFPYFRELLTFMGATLTAGVYTIFVDLTTRSMVVNQLGVDKIGMYSPIVSWASLFTGFILPSLTTYLFPRLSEAKTNSEVTEVVNDVFRLMTFILLPFIFIAIPIRNFIIPLFYSKDFLGAAVYLPFHFVGLFFTVWCFCFAQIFAPTGRIMKFVPIIIFNNTLSLGLVYFLTPKLGLWGWTSQFFVTPVIASFIYYFYWHKTIRFRFKKENLMILSLVLLTSLGILIFRNHFWINIFLCFCALISSLLILTPKEKSFLRLKMDLLKPNRHKID